jgi:hypothetical protein
LRRLLAVRRAEPAFSPAAGQTVHRLAPPVFALERSPANAGRVLCLHNVSGVPVDVALPSGWQMAATQLRDLLDPAEAGVSAGRCRLEAYGVRWLQQRDP